MYSIKTIIQSLCKSVFDLMFINNLFNIELLQSILIILLNSLIFPLLLWLLKFIKNKIFNLINKSRLTTDEKQELQEIINNSIKEIMERGNKNK